MVVEEVVEVQVASIIESEVESVVESVVEVVAELVEEVVIVQKGTRGDHFKNRHFYMLISFFKVEYDGSRTSAALANYRFKPFLRTLKMEISSLTNLLNELCTK